MSSSKSRRSRTGGKQGTTSRQGTQRTAVGTLVHVSEASKATATSTSQPGGGKRATTKRQGVPLWMYGALLIVVVLAALPIYRTLTKAKVGAAVSILPSPHVPGGTQTNYNSNPPTSGAHVESMVVPWATTSLPQEDVALVHNLEHGGIVLHYKPDLDEAQRQQLIDLADSLRRVDRKVVLAPREANNALITATAWGRIMKLDAVDPAQIRAFFEANRNRGPEQEPS